MRGKDLPAGYTDNDVKKAYSGLRVRGVSVEGGEPKVILDDRGSDRSIALPVGAYEASAIIIELECLASPRPQAHDLAAFFFTQGGFALDRVELFGGCGSAPRARLEYCRGLRKFEKEVRPADALALALRLNAPVFAESDLFAEGAGTAAPWRRSRVISFEEWKARA